ncbi:DUF1073 domain-containing protein [Phaeovibrio sulfidiphilus]|uniref:DUF1073 domain-containing protein n=1 Tax=Phaeovibrio sulfidiphilus TaxID=1220600 RepID=A0A8J7CR63_9PROT|nr:DUF1073 domain-containing protein [Phaeovibrio sulfidiphilus]MBE1237485.1 DUF1073 domain-containing protein [Phaeovibrio sulfidiphilus]
MTSPPSACDCPERRPLSVSPALIRRLAEDRALLGDARSGAAGLSCAATESLVEGIGGSVNYPLLAGLCRNGLIRAGIDTVAHAMTSEWIRLTCLGGHPDETQRAKLASLETALGAFGLQDVFAEAARMIGYFGGCLVFIDTGTSDPDVLRLPLDHHPLSFPKGALQRFTLIEPGTVSPGVCDTRNPLSEDYYRPVTWKIAGTLEVHRSRFLYFSAGDLPARIRPSYNFFGVPMAEVALDYVAHFTETRAAAARLLTKFSRLIFKTNMNDVLSGGLGTDMERRIQYAIDHWTNDDLFIIDKEDEDVIKVESTLGGVTEIVRQSLEMVAAIFRVPVMKLLGISPSGLNATGDADLRNFHENVGHLQEKQLNAPLEKALDVLQLHLFGEIDPALTFEWRPLEEQNEAELARIDELAARTLALGVEAGAITAQEMRAALMKMPSLRLDSAL